MKKVILFVFALFMCQGFAFSRNQSEPDKEVIIISGGALVKPEMVDVTIGNNTLKAMFHQEMDDVRVVVSGKMGEVVFEEEMDVQPFFYLPVYLPDYEEGTYRVEIITPEGVLEGEF